MSKLSTTSNITYFWCDTFVPASDIYNLESSLKCRFFRPFVFNFSLVTFPDNSKQKLFVFSVFGFSFYVTSFFYYFCQFSFYFYGFIGCFRIYLRHFA